LRPFDPIIKDTLKKEMLNVGVDIVTESHVKALAKTANNAITLSYTSNGEEGSAEFDTVLWAVGREPLLEKLSIENAGVTTNGKGYIVADDFQETVVRDVYALGDVCGIEQLTPGRLIKEDFTVNNSKNYVASVYELDLTSTLDYSRHCCWSPSLRPLVWR